MKTRDHSHSKNVRAKRVAAKLERQALTSKRHKAGFGCSNPSSSNGIKF